MPPKPKARSKRKQQDDDYQPTSAAERRRSEATAAITRGRNAASAAAASSSATSSVSSPLPPNLGIVFPPQPNHSYDENRQGPTIIPFRTPYKLVNVLHMGYANPDEIAKVHRIPRYIPKKQKRFMYYHVHGLNTWMIDIVFIKTDGSVFELSEADATVLAQAQELEEQPEEVVSPEDRRHFTEEADRILKENSCKKVLLCVHCNSRLAIAFIIENQKAITIIPCIEFLHHQFNCDTIISDAQASIAAAINLINGNDTHSIARRGEPIIKHISLNMSSKNNKYFHTMLSLVDRMCRTLRDMIYNVKFHNPNIEVNNQLLFKLCDIYNNVQHDKLTQVMEFPISPQEMFDHPNVQLEFIRRVSGHNYRIKDINNTIPEKEIVRIYNKPEPFKKRRNTVADDEYKVLGYDGRYYLQNQKTGDIEKYLRSQIVRY